MTKDFLQDINSHSSLIEESASTNEESTTKGTNEKSTKTIRNQELMASPEELKEKYKSLFFYRRKMLEIFLEESNSCCEAWVAEIFPNSEPSLPRENIRSVLLTALLFSSPFHIIQFCNDDFVSKCLVPLDVVDERVPSCCDMASTEQATFLFSWPSLWSNGRPIISCHG